MRFVVDGNFALKWYLGDLSELRLGRNDCGSPGIFYFRTIPVLRFHTFATFGVFFGCRGSVSF